jgi:hypothetical protein
MGPQLRDRRAFVRIPFATEVEVRTEDGSIRPTSDINISMNGIGFSTGQAVPAAGSACTVRIMLTASEPSVAIEARGTVVRTLPGGLAVEFTELDIDSYLHLRQLILVNADDPERAEREFNAHPGIRRPKG